MVFGGRCVVGGVVVVVGNLDLVYWFFWGGCIQGVLLFDQDVGGGVQVFVWIQGVVGVGEMMFVLVDIDLVEVGIDVFGFVEVDCCEQCCVGGGVGCVVVGFFGDV